MKLNIGQYIWFRNKETSNVEYAVVEYVSDDFLRASYRSRHLKVLYSYFGNRVYLTKQEAINAPLPNNIRNSNSTNYSSKLSPIVIEVNIPANATCNDCIMKGSNTCPSVGIPCSKFKQAHIQEVYNPEKTCRICWFRVNGECGQISDDICNDFRPYQHIDKDIVLAGPKYGTATRNNSQDALGKSNSKDKRY